jgi:aspartate aminotransferase
VLNELQESNENPIRLVGRLAGIAPPATFALAQKAREMAAAGRDVVNLTIGEPDFQPPKHVIDAMKGALERGETKYTAIPGVPELREAIAERYRQEGFSYDPSEIVVSTGAKQCIFSAVMALVETGDDVIIPAPYWLSYQDIVRFAGAKPNIVKTSEANGFLLTPAELERAMTPRSRVLFLNSPSNPTGALYEADDLRALAAVLAKHPEITILADEIYDSFVYGGRTYASILGVAPELRDRVVKINGCSKRYAMTGLRIGWAAGPKPLISAMSRIQGLVTSNPNSAAQRGAIAAVTGDQRFVAEMIEAFDARRRFVFGRLSGIPGVTCMEPKGAFYAFPNLGQYIGRTLPDGSRIDDTYSIAAHLLHDHALVVVPGGSFGSTEHIRLSFATTMEQLSKGLDRLRSALVGLGGRSLG